MKKWEENIRKVVPYVPGEQPQVKNIIKLNTNENPYPPSPGVFKAYKTADMMRNWNSITDWNRDKCLLELAPMTCWHWHF